MEKARNGKGGNPRRNVYAYTQETPLIVDRGHFIFVPAGAADSIACDEGYSLVFNFQSEGVPPKLTLFSGISFQKLSHLQAVRQPGYPPGALSILNDVFFRWAYRGDSWIAGANGKRSAV